MTIAPLPALSQVVSPTRADEDSRTGAPSPASTAAPVPTSAAPILNPDPVIDSSLGIVVLQYFSQTGDETASFPSRQQLDSYQIYGLKNGAPPG